MTVTKKSIIGDVLDAAPDTAASLRSGCTASAVRPHAGSPLRTPAPSTEPMPMSWSPKSTHIWQTRSKGRPEGNAAHPGACGVTVKCDLSDPKKQGRGNAVQPDFPAPSVTRPLMPEGDT